MIYLVAALVSTLALVASIGLIVATMASGWPQIVEALMGRSAVTSARVAVAPRVRRSFRQSERRSPPPLRAAA